MCSRIFIIYLHTTLILSFQVMKLESERDSYKKCFEPMKKKLREVEESESGLRIALEKAERDAKALKAQNTDLVAMFSKADADAKKSETAFRALDAKFKVRFYLQGHFLVIHRIVRINSAETDTEVMF